MKMDRKRPGECLGHSGYKTHKVVQKTNHPGLGGEYEVFWPAYLALHFLKNKKIKDFRLRSNVEGFDKFDDVLIDLKMKNGDRFHLAIQLKHKESENFKLTTDEFCKNRGQFNLKEYCKACCKIVKTNKEYKCVLYTNASFDSSDELKSVNRNSMVTMFSSKKCFVNDVLNTSDNNRNVYEVKGNTNREHYFLFVSQKNSKNLENAIKNIFQTECRAKDEKISTEYINLFRKWHKRQFTNDTLNRKTLSIHLVDLLIGNFIMESSKGTINRNGKLGLLEESVRMFDVTIIEDSELKLVEELGKCEDENCLPSYMQKISEKYAHDFRTDKESVILRLAKEYKFIDKFSKEVQSDKKLKIFNYLLGKPLMIKYSENFKDQISKVLEMDFKENVHIKFVLVGKEIDAKQFCNLKSFNNLQDLFNSNNNLYQNIINEIDISLQGREKIKLEKIITSHEELSKMIQVKHLFQEDLVFGKDLEKVPEYYIHRTVSVALLDENSVLKYFFKENYVIEKNDILMIDYGAEKDYLNSFAQRNSIEMIHVKDLVNKRKNVNTIHKNYIIVTNEEGPVKQQFDKICSMTYRNIHFLKINKPGEFLLIKSKKNITEDLSRMHLIETESPVYFSKGANVLCAEPGMGKTTTMKTIRNSYLSDYWTIFVELKRFDSLFKKNNLKTNEILDHFFNEFKEDAMCREVRKIFLSRRKVALFLDGLDEMNYRCVDNVLECVRKLNEEGFQVWVASRSNLREKIETKLNLFSINIIEINEEQQRQYITNRLRCDDKYSQDEINGIITNIFNSVNIKNNSNILGIPLQLFMLTQTFIDNKEENLELNDKLFVLTKLYTSYFEGKIKHELRKGGQTDKKYIGRIAKSELKQYQILGLRSSLNDEDWKKLDLSQKELKENGEFVEEIEKNGDCYGIVENVNEDKTVIFVHHTHGEYFAAVCLSENLDKVQVLGESFLTKKYDNLRLLFDIKLSENNPLHLSIIYKNLDQFDEHIVNTGRKDEGGRTPLHLACIYATKYSSTADKDYGYDNLFSAGDVVKKETDSNVKIVDKLLELYLPLEQDKVFKWSCIKYASKHWCLYPLEAILKKFNLVISNGKLIYESNNWQNNENLIDIFNIKYNSSLPFYASCLGYNNSLTNLIAKNGLLLNELKYNWDRKTLLHLACWYGHNETVKLLLENNANVNSGNVEGDTPLHCASAKGRNEIVKLLIKNNANVNSIDQDGISPLHYACRNEHYESAKLLIENNANVNGIDKYGNPPLHFACENGHNEIAKLLIENNANVNGIDKYGNPPLHLACQKGHNEIAKLLIVNNANVNSVNEDGDTPLHYACRYGHNEIVELLIENNANVNSVDGFGSTPLHDASLFGLSATATLLIENNALVNIVNEGGDTSLHEACIHGHYETAKLLIENNANVNSGDKNGNTPLHPVCWNGRNKTAKLLIDNNANVNCFNEMGDTPLHYACRNGHNETAKLLLQNNADVNSVDENGDTPLDCACDNGHNETVELLVQNMQM